jgi:polyhydroxyalkanoate synthesis regulator phasin
MHMNDLSPLEPAAPQPEPAEKPARRRPWLAGALLGVALCAVLLGGTAFAQTDSEGTSLGDSFVERLAEKLGLTSDELDAAIEETTNEMIDEAVADGRLSEERADALRERVESGNGFFRMMPESHGFGMHRAGPISFGIESIADTLGITTDELRAELDAGSSLSEIIAAHGSTVDAVVDALMADTEAELTQAVENGDLSQEQADRMLENLPEHLTRMIEGGFPGDCAPWLDRNSPDTEDTNGADETSNQV